MHVLVTGSSGKLGRELVMVLPDCLRPNRRELDITVKASVDRYLKDHEPDAIIHAAALTSVRKCEEDREAAWRINAGGTENVVKSAEANLRNCRFLYVSTACVFKGDRGYYTELDIPYPSNFYALTKLVGELLTSRLSNFIIVRTNFAAKERWPYAKAFKDRFGTYLFSGEVAVGLKEVLESNICGVVHLTGDKKMSMFDLAKLTTPNVEPMTLDDYSGPPLTVDMSLDTVRWKKYRLEK